MIRVVAGMGVAVGWWAAVATVACAQDVRARQPTDVVATVGDSPIFQSELDAVLRRGAGGGQVPVSGSDAARMGGTDRQQWLEAMALDQLIDQRLLRAEIAREQITVGRIDIDGRLEMLKKQVAGRGLEWEAFLAQAGRDERAVREQIELEIALDRLIRPKLTAAAIAAGFERHRRELDGTRLRVSHVILRPDAAVGEAGIAALVDRAAAIRREVLQGTTTFADAARRHSAGPSRAAGGDLGWIDRAGPLVDAFAKECFALAKGDISRPFVTPFGVHIVQVTAIEPGRLGIDALRPKLESLLAGNLLRETLARLRKTTPVQFGSGVAHFDPATPAEGGGPRRILVGDTPAAPSAP
jgi:parvulin-like peptidyl-prolyl isomerase